MTLSDFPEIDITTAAAELRRQYSRANLAQEAWLEDIIDLPFRGLPRRNKDIEIILAGATGTRLESLLDVVMHGIAAAHHDWMEIAAMEDAVMEDVVIQASSKTKGVA